MAAPAQLVLRTSVEELLAAARKFSNGAVS